MSLHMINICEDQNSIFLYQDCQESPKDETVQSQYSNYQKV